MEAKYDGRVFVARSLGDILVCIPSEVLVRILWELLARILWVVLARILWVALACILSKVLRAPARLGTVANTESRGMIRTGFERRCSS